MYFVGHFIEFEWEILYCGLYEEDVWQTAFSRIPMYLLGYFLERTRVRVYSDVKLLRVLASALIYKETVSSPDVDHYSLAGRGRQAVGRHADQVIRWFCHE